MLFRFACATALAALSAARSITNEERQSSGQQALQQIVQTYTTNIRATLGGQCNEGNIRIRREWGDLSPNDRRRYIAAAKCLAQRPPQTSTSYAPGVRNRHDDFDVTHITRWKDVHNSPLLLHWHREFLYQMEDALIGECGWTEGIPYWSHAKYAHLPPSQNPLFDGTDTSLSGNGTPHRVANGTVVDDDCNCITSGPFADWVVNIGPLNALCQNNPDANGLGYNPRCITRKFNTGVLGDMSYDVIVRTITQFTDITSLGVHIESSPEGIHPNGHTMIGGMQTDIPGSSSDHAFYCHHAGLDFYFSLWQGLDLRGRTEGVPNTEAYRGYRQGRGWDMVPQPTLDTELDFSPSFRSVRLGDTVSTTGGRYCYIYQ
ncbi:hypothetical protein M409DRAFT_70480 [Zasmidium cellare ATCC 36951]|uniref:Tyrosinase copper-binding domain-containing protein n=1 Tax=Zasmidium cellare ATCC 36951 TaxID=1080233 RepID=A0A6A6C4J6_ZASCE|nr:uncharacterized protein M409DRAFT_70480 [Zasmidium cellare ATCC 36951]KAF2160296.1 hypothetical protein M409DRAFT_70480 [Zasmidium cellare ATCC 36951]